MRVQLLIDDEPPYPKNRFTEAANPVKYRRFDWYDIGPLANGSEIRFELKASGSGFTLYPQNTRISQFRMDGDLVTR
ncbi:MAG: hypothetical protein Hyperionvirus3_54 [Hyperionvirus sp.]|uniref:Uncharacterized protein n=1 Tax=Hyperionvirus sp. TaxID=2487770 RepID=A0A3G5A6V6_9VIRU|nr:MAG: hypothetical protein Hyperionvirus3_54 [Hyperionvirus sp.]